MNMANDKINPNLNHKEIIKNIKDEFIDDFDKIFSIINLEQLNSIEEAMCLFKNLINHPTPIREATALKLEEIYSDAFYNNEIKEIFLKSIIDINPNVCRAIITIISNSELLKQNLCKSIIIEINKLIQEIKENDKKLGGFYKDAQKIRKNHAKNKKLFSLYWLLEGLSVCELKKNNSSVLEILNQTIKFNDYTIREKTAKIMMKLDKIPNELLQIAKNDQNFYVKNQVYDKMDFED